ncbi:hypothetical protein [Variovorax sp. DT-64]|uniref:hypothetical protein n=1 Tax=Variovorax sp. DT-64 TaxID=3396160 RepID=UPI003F1B3DAD
MANLAELDLAFSQPCKRCAQLLHGRVKFCPYCGGENDAPRWRDEAANTPFRPGRAAPDSAEPVAPPADEPPIVPRDEVREATDRPLVLEVRNEARGEVDLDIAHIVPAAFEWPEELPVGSTTPEPRAPAPRRGAVLKYTAIGVAMAVSVLVLVLGYFRSNEEGEAGRPHAPTAQRTQARIAPTAREEDASPALAPQAAEAPLATAPAPVAAVAASPAPALAPAPPMATPQSEKTGCSEALAALALCPDTGGAR